MNVYFVIFIQQLITGGTHIVAKAVVTKVDAATLTFMRSIISTVGLAGAFLLKGSKLKIERQDWKTMVLLGLIAIPINQFFYLYGMKFTTAANGALLYAITPVIVLVLSRVILKERVTVKKTLGIALAFVGVSIVVFERGVDFSSDYTFGNLMILIAVVAWALFTIHGRKMILKYGAFQTTAVAMILGMFLFFPVGLIASVQFPFSELTPFQWAGILYLGVGTSILGYFLWYYALGKIETSKVAVFANGQPIVATLLSLMFLDYTITPPFVVGGVITITGVVITQRG